MLKKIIRRLKCKHTEQYTITNVYGDAINRFDCRSISKCKNCGKFFFHDSLDKNCNRSNDFSYKE